MKIKIIKIGMTLMKNRDVGILQTLGGAQSFSLLVLLPLGMGKVKGKCYFSAQDIGIVPV